MILGYLSPPPQKKIILLELSIGRSLFWLQTLANHSINHSCTSPSDTFTPLISFPHYTFPHEGLVYYFGVGGPSKKLLHQSKFSCPLIGQRPPRDKGEEDLTRGQLIRMPSPKCKPLFIIHITFPPKRRVKYKFDWFNSLINNC